MNTRPSRRTQHGFIASYVLYGIALLAVVGAAYGRLSITTQQDRMVQKTIDEVRSQLEVLSGKILLCAAVYPNGDHGQFDTRHAYPAPSTAGNREMASAVECPGAPVGSRLLANMPDGVPVPVSPNDFNPWVYEHTEVGGIRLRLDPRVDGGAEAARNRLLVQFPQSAVPDGDEIVFLVLN